MGISEKLMNGIERVRMKSESTRWAIVISLTMIITAALIVFWVAMLPQRFAALKTEGSSEAAGLLGPLESLKKTIKTFTSGIR